MCSFGGGSPPPVTPAVAVAAPPTPVDSAVTAAGNDERRRAAGARGYDSTLLADPLGLGTANLKRQTLLGGAQTQLG